MRDIINRLDSCQVGFDVALSELLSVKLPKNKNAERIVLKILKKIKDFGDAALLEYTKKFDQFSLSSISELEIPKSQLNSALHSLPIEQRKALELANDRIFSYHKMQSENSWSYLDKEGTLLGQKITALNRVGLYVPGGKAAYPSSVLMNAIPAKIAGVSELIMVNPTPNGIPNTMVLAAAALSGIDRVFSIGGAQAIGALAYGTKTIPAVDKIVGPGNIYVALAKKLVFGIVGIDMIAGPSEILIICDGKTPADWITMDLFSQAEHDELAQSILLCPDNNFINDVEKSIKKLLNNMPRSDILCKSLKKRGALILVKDLQQACDIANEIAPEHLEISTEYPEKWIDSIHHAGSIFMGCFSSEAVGDYCAGPNHVLPTNRTARFSSPLGVYDFQKRSNIIKVSRQGAKTLGKIASILASAEGLHAHATSANYRI